MSINLAKPKPPRLTLVPKRMCRQFATASHLKDPTRCDSEKSGDNMLVHKPFETTKIADFDWRKPLEFWDGSCYVDVLFHCSHLCEPSPRSRIEPSGSGKSASCLDAQPERRHGGMFHGYMWRAA